MIDATVAVEIAGQSLPKVVPTFAALEPHVEEVQRSRDGDSWVITFRAENPDPKSEKRGFGEVFFPYIEKIVRVQIESGDLLSVTNPSYE
jgi:hypothetical protein